MKRDKYLDGDSVFLDKMYDFILNVIRAQGFKYSDAKEYDPKDEVTPKNASNIEFGLLTSLYKEEQ